MWLICLWLWAGEPFIEQWLTVSDEAPLVGDHYLVYPADAVSDGSRLLVADTRGFCLYLVDEKGARRIGEKGGGPGTFKNGPVRVELTQRGFDVFEWNYHRMSSFSHAGDYLSEGKPERGLLRLGNREIIRHHIRLAVATGHHYRFRDGCMFAPIDAPSVLGHHRSRMHLALTGDGTLYAVEAAGRIGIVTTDCELEWIMRLPVTGFRRDPRQKDREAVFFDGRMEPLYEFGVPILSAAATHDNRLWVLARNEHDEGRHLFLVDPVARRMLTQKQLEGAFETCRLTNGILILIAPEEALVQAFHYTGPNASSHSKK